MLERNSIAFSPHLARQDTGGSGTGKDSRREHSFHRMTEHQIDVRVEELADETREYQIPRAKSTAAQRRVNNSVDRFFKPYVRECLSVADQLGSEPYLDFVDRQTDFLEVAVGVVVCPEDRIASVMLVDPRVEDILRRAGGLPEYRTDTATGKSVLNDPDVEAAIQMEMKRREKNGKKKKVVEFRGGHIRSDKPEEGCGAIVEFVKSGQHSMELGIVPNGGINKYYQLLGEGKDAFDNTLASLDADCTTIDLTHNITSQGVIFGLEQVYRQFDPELTLEQNLQKFADANNIFMNERLLPQFYDQIGKTAQKLQHRQRIDLRDYHNTARNAILIGDTARVIIEDELKKHPQNPFPWVPQAVKDTLKDDDDLRVLAYMAMRNVTILTLADIEPGNHDDLHHRAMATRIGPVGAAFNTEHPALGQNTHSGALTDKDLSLLDVLGRVQTGTYRQRKINRRDYAGIIMPTQRSDEAVNEDNDYRANQVARINSTNADIIRERYLDAIEEGEWTIIPVQHKAGTKELTSVQS